MCKEREEETPSPHFHSWTLVPWFSADTKGPARVGTPSTPCELATITGAPGQQQGWYRLATSAGQNLKVILHTSHLPAPGRAPGAARQAGRWSFSTLKNKSIGFFSELTGMRRQQVRGAWGPRA